MIRELFRIGPLSISPFGVMLMLAFFAAFTQLRAGMRRLGVGDEEDASAVFLSAAIGGVIGGKVYYSVLYRDWRLLFDRSGLVWYGGLLLGTLAVLLTVRRRKLAVWPMADAVFPAVALGYSIGRIGCFLVGDDYGRPTDGWWGVKFPVGLPPSEARWLRSDFGVDIPAGVPGDTLMAVHPTQLYETVLAAVIWVVAIRLLRLRLRPGSVGLVTVALLAVERFGIEFLRAKDDRFLGPFTLAQALSLAVLATAVMLWSRRPREPG